MLDANYFRTAFPRDVEASGGSPVVEILLRNGQVHRVRSIVEIGDGWIALEVHPLKGDLSHERPRFGGDDSAHETMRAVLALESISGIVFDPAPVQVRARTGFGFNAG
jgi:hypothetical protein